ncbi:MAG TPA: GNAT family N-acetyltransferase [Chthoniobacteraceae bacterium]|nr:GNAT family N-acetyltransferase [Chthoniobacteraceae bacterium]
MLTFRLATDCDIAVLRKLADRIWRTSYAGTISQAQVDYMLAWMYSEETICRELAEGVHWEIVRHDECDVGYFSITVGADCVAKLHKLYLLPEFQGRGLGQEMLVRIFAVAAQNGVSEVRLQVNKANTRAQRAYQRFGFRRVGEAVFDIGGGFVMDDYIMARFVHE